MSRTKIDRQMTQLAAGRISDPDGWCRYWLPYCFHELDANRRHVYLPLNRDYKPLGVCSRTPSGCRIWVDYEDYIDQAVVFASDPRTFPDVWTEPGCSDRILYLYNDGTASRLDYFERLERLLSRSVRLAVMVTRVGRNGQKVPIQASKAPAKAPPSCPLPPEAHHELH